MVTVAMRNDDGANFLSFNSAQQCSPMLGQIWARINHRNFRLVTNDVRASSGERELRWVARNDSPHERTDYFGLGITQRINHPCERNTSHVVAPIRR